MVITSLILISLIGIALYSGVDAWAHDDHNESIMLQDVRNDYYYEHGELTKSTHGLFDRLLDYTDNNGNPVYVDSKLYDNGETINFESANNSYYINKDTCTLAQVIGGHITGNESPSKVLSHTFKKAVNQQ